MISDGKRRMLRPLLLFAPAWCVGIGTACASVAGWPFPDALVGWGMQLGSHAGVLGEWGSVPPWWPAVALFLGIVLCILWRQRTHGSGDVDTTAAATLAVLCVPLFTGIDRDVGSNFISHWQCWSCPHDLSNLRESLAIGPGTARCSMDGSNRSRPLWQ